MTESEKAALSRQKRHVASNAVATGSLARKKLGGCTGKGFMPGQSGNPRGSYRKRLLDEALEQELETGGGEAAKAIARALIKRARRGDTRTAQFIAERTEGKPKQKVEATGEDGPLSVQVRFVESDGKALK